MSCLVNSHDCLLFCDTIRGGSMLISAIILGWIGVLVFIIIISIYKLMVKNNEFALLHLFMTFMYAMWLPVPIALSKLFKSEILNIGAIFGFVYILMLVITMAFQIGHIASISKHNGDQLITNQQANYMMRTLSNPFEGIANVFKCMWSIFLAITFWNNGELLMASIMGLFSLLLFYYLLIVIDTSLVKQLKYISKLKSNFYFTNLETLLFFIILISYMTFNY